MEEIDFNISQLVEFDGAKLKESDLKMFTKLKGIKRQQLMGMEMAASVQRNMIEPSPLFNPPEGQVSRFIDALPNILGTRFRRLLPVQIFESHQYFLVICQLQQYSVHVRYHTEYLNAFVMRYGYTREHMAGIGKLRLMVKNACILIEVVDLIISRLRSLTCGMCKNVDSCEEMRGQYCFDLHNEMRKCISDNLRSIHRIFPSFPIEKFGNDLVAMFLYREDRPPKTRGLYIQEVAKYVA